MSDKKTTGLGLGALGATVAGVLFLSKIAFICLCILGVVGLGVYLYRRSSN